MSSVTERPEAPPAPRTIPALPCISLDETLAFWTAIGFTVTYRQAAPSPYGVVARDGYELHISGLKGMKADENFTTCLVMVADVETLHAEFDGCLRTFLGRAPAKGLPRISRMRPGQTRFTLTDPNGNSVIFIKFGPEDEVRAQAYKDETLTPLQRAVRMAERLRDYHLDDHAASKALDVALRKAGDETPEDRRAALLMRAELARVQDDAALAERLEAEAGRLEG
ncbi:MAG: hypothetical protein KF809_14705 [Chloroflexi bacterium]|nr:hypothetical protein [Chloroflexota bacterium]